MSNVEFGKILIVIGIAVIIIGVFFLMSIKIPFLGKLPGDVRIQKENFSFYFPITTCIVISIILSVFFALFFRR